MHKIIQRVLFILLLIPTPIAAQPTQDPEVLSFGKDGKVTKYEQITAAELMTAEEFKLYQQALDTATCAKAGAILNTAFIRSFPEFSRISLKTCTVQDCLHWNLYSRRVFLSYGYCEALKRFKKSERKLLKTNKNPPKFSKQESRDEQHYDDRLVAGRDLSLVLIIRKARNDHVPAILKVVELLRRGDVFDAGTEVEYYLLQRTCVVSGNCDAHQSRLRELEKEFGTDRANELTKLSRASDKKRPNIHKLLLGGQVKERLNYYR